MFKIFKNKIIFAYFISLTVLFLLSALFVNFIFKKESIKKQIDNLKDTAAILKTIEKDKLKSETRSFKESNIRLNLIDEKGQVIFDSELKEEETKNLESHLKRPEILKALKEGEGYDIRLSATVRKKLIYYARHLPEKKLIIRLSAPYESFDKTVKETQKKVLIYLGVLFLLMGFIGARIIKLIFEPLEEIIFASKQFSKGDFDYRIPIKSDGEVKKLAQTLNKMAEEIKKNINEMENYNKLFSMLFDNMKEAIAIFDSDLKLAYANSHFLKIFNQDAKNISNKSLTEISMNIVFSDTVKKSKNEKKNVEKELCIEGIYYLLSCLYVKTKKEIIISVLYNIDKQKKLDEMKKDFIANFSHEIKTPLTVIKTNIETVRNPNISEKDKEYFLLATEKNIQRMENIIKDIISLNYIETDPPIILKEINLNDFVSDIINQFEPKIKEKNISLNMQIPNDLKILTDEELFKKIIINLIDNAIKYNRENGFVNIIYNKEYSKLSFENSGIIIPKEYLNRIFERFFTIDKSHSRNIGGTGLGLSIAKHAAEKLGIKIYAESDSNSNFFHLILP
ncbi:MAG: ATP-binding protein [Elusimicrobiales bacterium]|nr:ATP-binding protein [Elusimicrobiales bacterium]HOJ85353.1 ATP-binding protein [Elusimicrobiales bacterium]HOL62059.1 ATP-binding protein [Elusimicrobiales bacterium]HPO95310.1 ATP-binding protein [Elusimicrobiales bacterium]